MASPGQGMIYDAKSRAQAVHTRSRLEQCWTLDANWELYPNQLHMGCSQVGKALSMPPVAVLAGIISVVAFFLSHSVVEVVNTDWVEPVLLWISVGMPTGSGKSPLYKYLLDLIRMTRRQCGLDETKPGWLLEDATFEKMGDLMDENHGKLMGLYDELSTFLTQMNLYRGKGLAESHDLALFLQLYNATPWVRRTVSGDANFSMDVTALTIGGFTQPMVARNLIELQASVEKGLSPRFLWIFPKPKYAQFETLEKVDESFTHSLVSLTSSLWKPSRINVTKWKIPNPFPCYQAKYNEVQAQLRKLSGLDELLSGMLSKSKGQILRVAAVLHVLFHLEQPDKIPPEISVAALKAADNFVSVCLQHAAYIAGRGLVEEAIKQAEARQSDGAPQGDQAHANASISLTIPGKTLHLTALLTIRKFRKRGDKEGALAGFRLLEKAKLGKVDAANPKRGTAMVYKFLKAPIPTCTEAMEEFCGTLLPFGVSLAEYREALELPDITMESIEKERLAKKRAAAEVQGEMRKSPRRNLTQQMALALAHDETEP